MSNWHTQETPSGTIIRKGKDPFMKVKTKLTYTKSKNGGWKAGNFIYTKTVGKLKIIKFPPKKVTKLKGFYLTTEGLEKKLNVGHQLVRWDSLAPWSNGIGDWEITIKYKKTK